MSIGKVLVEVIIWSTERILVGEGCLLTRGVTRVFVVIEDRGLVVFLPFLLDKPGVVLVVFLRELVEIVLHVTNLVRYSGECVGQPEHDSGEDERTPQCSHFSGSSWSLSITWTGTGESARISTYWGWKGYLSSARM